MQPLMLDIIPLAVGIPYCAEFPLSADLVESEDLGDHILATRQGHQAIN